MTSYKLPVLTSSIELAMRVWYPQYKPSIILGSELSTKDAEYAREPPSMATLHLLSGLSLGASLRVTLTPGLTASFT